MKNIIDIQCTKAIERCELDRRNALVFMKQKGPLEPGLQERFEAIADECDESLPVYGTWRTFSLEPLDGQLGFHVVGTQLELPGMSIAKHLKDATHAVLMAFTLGMDYEREAARYEAKNALDALMFDACASSLVDSGADVFQQCIKDELTKAGYVPCGFRYSPGYGDLPLDVQPAFLDVLDAGRNIGVYSTSHNFLKPAKSITAILGARPVNDMKGGTA